MNTEQNFPDLGKYHVLDALGQGRFATVYRVEDTLMGRHAAAKVFDPQLFQDELWAQRLRDHVRTLARLQHPHIIPIYEIGDTEAHFYLAMQLARDGSLAQAITAHSGQCIPWDKALAFLKPICEALHYAHEQGVVHGDLKPANILIDPPGGPLIMDFGLTRLMAENSVGLSRLQGGLTGTLAYIAPEVWETEPPEIPADIYALGCITYEMLLGQKLFEGGSVMQAMHAHAQGPQWPTTWPNDIPNGIQDILGKALAWDKTTRYPTPMAFWAALHQVDQQATSGTGAQLAAMAAQWRTKAESAIQSGKLQIAKMAVNQWLAAEPNNPEALKAQATIDKQMATQAPPAPTPAQPAATPAPPPAPPAQAQAPAPPQPAPAQPTPPQPASQPSAPNLFTFHTLPDQHTGTLINPYTVEQFISTEGNVDAYEAEVNGQEVTLRWVFPTQASSEKRAFLESLIQQGPPVETFLWPSHLVESSHAPGFGYIIPKPEPRYQSMEALIKRWIEPTFYTLISALLDIVESFTALHMKGLCYNAASPRNFLFDPNTGDVKIIYTDHIVPENSQSTLQSPNSLRFMAPEIVRQEATPGLQTDLYTLATLLFYALMVHHPLEGEKVTQVTTLDLPTLQRLYGEDPIFIFDPNNDTNRPVPGYHTSVMDYWPLYPQFIQDMFVQSFTSGIQDPYSARIRESEWRKALVTLRDAIIYCPQCSAENFYDLEVLKASGGKPGTCWSCNSALILPPRLRVEDSIIMLNYNTKLYPHHIDPDRRYDFSQPIAEVTQHPQNPNIWGIKNLANEKWVITTDNGQIKDVVPGRSLTLAPGIKINFGKREGEIRV